MAKTVLEADCRTCRACLTSVFETLRTEDINRLNADKICTLYRRGQVIYREGARPFGVFCIKTGRVKEYVSSRSGHEQIVRILKEGDILGHEALLAETMYEATAETLEDSALCFVTRSTFTDLLACGSPLCPTMIALMSAELQDTKRKVAEMALKNTRERLADTLLDLRETYGVVDDTATLNLPLTREDLARIVGAAPENVIRLLSEFRREKLISIHYRQIRLLDIPTLQAIAGRDNLS